MNPETFLAILKEYKEIFWPDFEQHDNCIFLKFDKNIYSSWSVKLKGNKTEIESVMNHRHVIDLLPTILTNPSYELIIFVGSLLKDIWEIKLRNDFPNKKFQVVISDERTKGLNDYAVTFFQNRVF